MNNPIQTCSSLSDEPINTCLISAMHIPCIMWGENVSQHGIVNSFTVPLALDHYYLISDTLNF